MTGGRLLLFLVALALAFSGCISAKDVGEAEGSDDDGTDQDASGGGEASGAMATSWSWSSGGHTTTDQKGTLQAPAGGASLSYSAGGAGQATVTVTDAAGKVVYSRTLGADGGSTDSTSLSGSAGTWTVEVDFTSWSGGFTISVHGH